jgi:ribosomal protein S18 acetylase RimI-like enzyme
VTLRAFGAADYAAAVTLWTATEGVGLGPGDAEPELRRFLERNPGLSLVATDDGQLVGAALCGHDGRRGYIYHLAVKESHRRRGLGRELARRCLDGLAAVGIRRAQVSVFAANEGARAFWQRLGGLPRSDLVVLSFPLAGA